MSYIQGQPAGEKAGYVYLGAILRKNLPSWEEIWRSLEIIEVEKRLPKEAESENMLHCAVLETEYKEESLAGRKKGPKKKKEEHVPDPEPPKPKEEEEEKGRSGLSISVHEMLSLPPPNAIFITPKDPSSWPIEIEVIEAVQVKDVHRLDKTVYASPGKYRAREEKIHNVVHLIIEVNPVEGLEDLHFHFGVALASWQMKEGMGKVKINRQPK